MKIFCKLVNRAEPGFRTASGSNRGGIASIGEGGLLLCKLARFHLSFPSVAIPRRPSLRHRKGKLPATGCLKLATISLTIITFIGALGLAIRVSRGVGVGLAVVARQAQDRGNVVLF